MMNIHYLNSKGEKLNLVEWPYRIQTGNIVDFKKSYIYSNSPFSRKILGFDFGVTEKSIVLTISARTKMEYHAALNHFYDVTEHDVMNITPGRLYVNEWYISCFIYGTAQTVQDNVLIGR